MKKISATKATTIIMVKTSSRTIGAIGMMMSRARSSALSIAKSSGLATHAVKYLGMS